MYCVFISNGNVFFIWIGICFYCFIKVLLLNILLEYSFVDLLNKCGENLYKN